MDVLTEQGWKPLSDLQRGERVASYTPDRRIEYHPVQELHTYPYDGSLVMVNQQHGIRFQVTPDHPMVIDLQRADSPWHFRRAEELKTNTLPRNGQWQGNEQSVYHLPMPSGQGCGRNVNAAPQLPMDDWLEFLGWWMSEGCSFRMDGGTGSPVISIRQTKADYLSELTALFQRLPWRHKIYPVDGQYIILSKQLYDELHPLGNAHTKRIPRWVFTLTPRQLRIFWDAFVKGDGHRGHSGETVIGLCNPGLIDDLQEIAVLLGLVGTTRYTRTKDGFDKYHLYVSDSRSGTMIERKSFSCVEYQGLVCEICVMPYHTFLVRRDGRYFWIGDSEIGKEPIAKIPTMRRGQPLPESHRRNIGKALKNRTFSEVTRAKLSAAAQRRSKRHAEE